MNFTLEKLKEARDAGIPDDVIWEVASETEPKFLELKQNNIPIDIAIEVFQGGEPEPSGTSFGEEVSQLGSAFVESIGRPLENMGESFESFGFSGVANALKGAITEPENYVSAGQRFMEPAPDEAQLMGFAWQYAPRAAVEQVGQVIGAIGTRAVGAAAGGAVAGPPGAIAGGFLGPAVFGAAQVIGPVAKERAMNNGREVPNNSDLVAATLTAIGSGSLDAIGAKYLPGGDKATGKFFKRVASSFLGEGLLTEAPQSVIEQIGATAGTEKGLNINVKQAVGEGLIGGTSAAGLTAIVSPFSKPAENQVIRTPEEAEELDINAKANQEAVLLMGDPADQTQNERVTKLKEIESVIANNETLMTGLEPNAPERSKLDLENRVAKKEAEKLKAEITQGAGLSETITEAEKQQIELGKLIAAPPEEKPAKLPTMPSIEEQEAGVTYGGETGLYDVFGGITRKPVAIPRPAELPAAPTIEEQTAERTYGGETGVFDVFAGARRKPVVTEEPPVSMVGKQVIPGVTPVPVIAKAPTEPTVKESLTVAPVEEEPFGKLPTAEVETGISQRAKEAAIAEEREKIEAPIRRQESINQFLSEGATVKSRTNVVGRKKAAEGGGDITKTAYYLAHPDGKREITLSKKEASDLEAPAITPTPVAETPAVTEAPAAEVAPAITPAQAFKQRVSDKKEAERIDKENAPIKFTTQKGSQYSVGESGTIYRDKFDGKKFKADKIGFVSKDDADKIAELQNQYEGKAIRVIHEPNKVRFVTDHQLSTEKTVFEATTSTLPQEGMYPIEGSNFVPHLGDVITSVSTPTPAVSETITPAEEPTEVTKFADEALRERDKEVGRYKKKADAERRAGREEMAQRYEGMIDDLLSVPANEFKQDVIENPEYYIESNIDPFLRFKNKEVNRATSTTKPAGISVGNRIKLGKSPQTYIVEEVVPQSEAEKANGEQFYSVKNEKTGEVQVVEKADMKQVKKSADTRKTVVGDTQYQTEGVIPEDQRFTEDELRVIVNDIFEGKIPDKIEIITDATDPNKEFKAAYSISRGTITYNLAYLAKGDDLRFVTNHELGHFILGDPKFQVEMARLFDTLPTDIQEKLKKAIDEAYAQEGMGVRAEETIVFAFGEILENAPDGRNILQRFLDAIRDAINRLFKTEGYIPRNPKKAAAAILLAARNKFERGEFIRREDGSILKMTPSEPDIRRMAPKRESQGGAEVGPPKKTPKGIIAETKKKLREQVFDPTKVTEQNTVEAFRAIGKLIGNRKEAAAYAEEINDITRMIDPSGAASEATMGAALFINDLFEYAVKLASQGQKMMLGVMMTNINKLALSDSAGLSISGRNLRAAAERNANFKAMSDAEYDAFINYAAEFVYGPNPTKEQVDSIRQGYEAVEEVKEPTAKEVEEEIAAVGEKTGTDLVGKINEEFTKATENGREKRKTEEEELDKEYKKIQNQADAEIEKLAKIQSDTPSFDPAAARQTANDVRAIVANDLKQRPDMGRKAPWKSMLVAKLQEAGVELAAAETLADIVWRQHEINNLSRELSSINKAIEKGPISEIIKAIKETPLEEQQKPNWRYEVMRDYLRKAGLPLAQAERIAKLMDISLQKKLTQAKEQAFTDAISKTAPWKAGNVRSKRAFQQVLQAIRAGALDPSRNMASDIAALNGWTGFTADQYKSLLKFDAILADEKTGELEKANAYKGVQDIISKSKLPIRARDVIAQYYDAQALSGIPTLSVNSFSPIAFAMRNAIVEAGSETLKGDPKAIGRTATIFVDSIKSWANTTAFSFKNNVTVYSNVDYIVNDDNLLRLYRRGVDQFQKGNTPREKADGIKNIMIGMMDYVRRVLNALDYGAVAALQNQNVGKYAMAVMKRNNISEKQANEIFGVMMKEKNDFYLNQIAIGTDKNKARILADEFYISSWQKALEKTGIGAEKIKSAMDSAINDAMSSVGRNRQSLDAFKEEATNTRDAGLASAPALWLLESIANSANQSNSQVTKLFARMIYGFAIVPARVIRETAWFSPYGLVRLAVDAGMRNRNMDSRYAQSLGNEFQRQQRLNEAVAGTVALVALLALRAGSTDDPEDEDAFKIVFTGNGPKRNDDPQFYDSWYKAGNKPNSMIVSFGKTKIPLNMMRGFEAFTWPAMMLGALDDLEIRKKQKQKTNTPAEIEDAAIVAGFVFDAALRRGPYAFTTKSLFGTYGDIGIEGVAKGLTFPAKTLIPVLGSSLASNISNFLNDPIDRRTLDGAIWSNIPFIGPAVAPKSLNAFGEPSLSTDFASKMFKLGVPIVYDIPTDRESIKLHELVLKQGGGPSIPTRNQLAQRLDREPTNKEYEMFVTEYGAVLTRVMKKNYDTLFNANTDKYSKLVDKLGLRARDIAENKVRQAAKKP